MVNDEKGSKNNDTVSSETSEGGAAKGNGALGAVNFSRTGLKIGRQWLGDKRTRASSPWPQSRRKRF